MSQLAGDWQDFTADPRAANYPLAYYSTYSLTFSGSQFLECNHNAGNQDAWLIGPRSVLSWQFRCSPTAHRGASLIIHIGPISEVNPALSAHVWRVYKLSSGQTAGIPQNHVSGLQLPAFMYMYLEVLTAENNLTLQGTVKLEARL